MNARRTRRCSLAVCGAFTAFPLGRNTLEGEKNTEKEKPQGACVGLQMRLWVGKYLESKHFDTSRDYS